MKYKNPILKIASITFLFLTVLFLMLQAMPIIKNQKYHLKDPKQETISSGSSSATIEHEIYYIVFLSNNRYTMYYKDNIKPHNIASYPGMTNGGAYSREQFFEGCYLIRNKHLEFYDSGELITLPSTTSNFDYTLFSLTIDNKTYSKPILFFVLSVIFFVLSIVCFTFTFKKKKENLKTE